MATLTAPMKTATAPRQRWRAERRPPPPAPCRAAAASSRCRPHAWRAAAGRRQPEQLASILDDYSSQPFGEPRPDRSAEVEQEAVEVGIVWPQFPDLSRDPVKEDARKFRRTVFDFAKWREHRSTERYVRHMRSMLDSRMVRGLSAPLFFIFSVASAVSAYNACVEAGIAPNLLPELQMQNNGPFGLTSFALSLLLVFRTNASYARWLAARKAWGSLINRSRDITRQAITYFPREDKPLLDLLCRWVCAYPRALMCHVTEDSNMEAEVSKVLLPHEVEALMLAKHRPNYCLQIISETLKTAHLPAPPDASVDPVVVPAVPAAAAYRMDENLTAFADILGTCERLLRAPIPLSYTRHTSRFMMIWLTLLPFSLWPSVNWATVPLSVIVAFLLLGIEEIGVSIEEPFSILPLEQLCDTIEANVREMRKVHSRSGDRDGSQAPRAPAARDIVRAAVIAAAADREAGSAPPPAAAAAER